MHAIDPFASPEAPISRSDRIQTMYVAGHTVSNIGRVVGVTTAEVRAEITALLADPGIVSRTDMIRTEQARLDALLRTFLPLATMTGDVDAARVCLSISDQRRKLLGLDAPTEVRVDATMTVAEIGRTVESILAEVMPEPDVHAIESGPTMDAIDISPARVEIDRG